MAVRELTNVDPELLRELASWGREDGRVLTLLMDLDPSRFATAEARGSEISSLVDEAHRAVEEAGLAHDELLALRERADEARDYLDSGDYTSEARGLALFGRSSSDDLQPVRLTRTSATRVALARWPLLAPLAREAAAVRRSGVPVIAFSPTPADLEVMGWNAMSGARRPEIVARARASAAERLNDPRCRDRLAPLHG